MDKKQYETPFPPQHQSQQPGIESLMVPKPVIEDPNYRGASKLRDKVAIISGGDSGIGAATAIAFAKEGADVVIPYYYSYEDEDAFRTKNRIEELGRDCLLIVGDLRAKQHCQDVVDQSLRKFGKIDILINNHGVQFTQKNLMDISPEQLHATFQTNIIAFFYLTQATMPYLKKGSSIVNTTSITAYEGEVQLMDYSSTKGAILAFTRSLSQNIVDQGIRVNAVAPGPIWTPLIPASYSAEYVATKFGLDVPMKRAGQPFEVAPAYVYLASNDSSYVTGQVIHVNGGQPVSS